MEQIEKLDLYQDTIKELRPFEGEMLKELKEFYRIGLTWTSNALEGNSLTERIVSSNCWKTIKK